MHMFFQDNFCLLHRELVTYQKLITSAYCDQIMTGKNKQSDKLVVTHMKV